MTAEAQAMTMEETAPMTVVADMAATDPILTNAELNLELAAKRLSIARARSRRFALAPALPLPRSAAFTYLNRSPQIRTTILSMPVSTRADAIAALSIIESDAEDSDLCVHLIAGLRVYLSGSCI